jgi:hypothetical protein
MARRSRRESSPKVEQLLSTLRAHMPELREQYHVRSLWAFGSYVRGEAKKRSDLDLLVEFERAPTFFEFVRLERHIGALLGLKVDLVMRTALKPDIGVRILEEIVPV